MDNRRNIMLITCDKAVNGSVTYEEGKLTVILNGIDDGVYDICLSGKKVAEAVVKGKGRFVKRIDGVFDGDIAIKKDGEEIAWVKNYEKDEVYAYEAAKEAVTEEKPPVKPEVNKDIEKLNRDELSFPEGISAVIARFREQMERLENISVLDREEITCIESGKKNVEEKTEIEWKAAVPDDLWTLPLKNIRFPSSLFCIYGYMKFGHLYIKEMGDRYRIAVPDIFKSENMPVAAREGFYSISTLDGGEVAEGDTGYWMADILKN